MLKAKVFSTIYPNHSFPKPWLFLSLSLILSHDGADASLASADELSSTSPICRRCPPEILHLSKKASHATPRTLKNNEVKELKSLVSAANQFACTPEAAAKEDF